MPITNQQIIDIVNGIRNEIGGAYADNVPIAELGNIGGVANPIITHRDYANSFLNVLINRIGLTIVHGRTLTNPLAEMKTGALPLGSDIQEVYTNPAEAVTFDPTDTSDLLSIARPDTRVAYHRLNSQKKFEVSVSEQQLRQAFVSWDALAKLVESIINSIYSGMYKYEYETTKALLTGAYTTNAIRKVGITAITDEASAKAFVKKARTYFSLFKYPREDCNAYAMYTGSTPVTTWTNPEDIRLIITSEALANVDVDVLAAAFNMDKATLLGQIIEVDSFYDDDIVAILCDKSFCQIWDVLEELRDFGNGSNLTYKYWLHKWQVFSTSLFANAIAFHTGTLGELTATSEAGTATGDSKVTVTGATVGATLLAKLTEDYPAPATYGQVPTEDTGWIAFTSGANIAASVIGDNEYITVVEVDTDGKVVKAGSAELVLHA